MTDCPHTTSQSRVSLLSVHDVRTLKQHNHSHVRSLARAHTVIHEHPPILNVTTRSMIDANDNIMRRMIQDDNPEQVREKGSSAKCLNPKICRYAARV
jgi:hypothetical protein